jgi:hypothetical protein
MNENNILLEPIVNKEPTSSQSSHYAIRIKGLLDPHWEWLEGLTVTYIDPGDTLLTGPIIDQAALHGLITRIRDLNLTLLSVNQIDPEQPGKEEENEQGKK